MIDYLVHSSITNLKNPSKVVDIKVAGSGFKILITPLIDDVLQGAGEGYTLVTLLQQPWYSYPFMLPLKDYVDPSATRLKYTTKQLSFKQLSFVCPTKGFC